MSQNLTNILNLIDITIEFDICLIRGHSYYTGIIFEIISTDNEIGIKTKVKAISDGNNSFTLNGKKFIGIL